MTFPSRLSPRGWTDRTWGWLGPIGVALLAFVLRIWNVGYPDKFVFDETYYAKDAWSLLQHGYVQDFTEDANKQVIAGHLHGILTGEPSWIIHPDGAKWLIALGEWIFGFNSFGWRISGVVVGALTVLVLARLVRRLTGSTLVGCIAGLLLTVDGMHFVMSRLSLVDGFLAFWIVCGVACLVADRDWIRDRLDRYRFFRPWQLLAGLSLGMACATKWSGLYVLAAFGLMVVVWEVVARKTAPAGPPVRRHGWVRTTLMVGVPAFGSIVLLAFVVYLVSWTGFLLHHEAYEMRFGRGYGDYSAPWGSYVSRPTPGFLGETRDAFRSLWHFHVMTYDFSAHGLTGAERHPYQSNPAGWLVQWRPVGADAVNDLPAASCGAASDSTCMREILILGNPILWWSGALALVAALGTWFATSIVKIVSFAKGETVPRFQSWSIPVVAVLVSWVPWFASVGRPIFSYYAVVMIPFTIIAICLVINALIQSGTSPRHRYVIGLTIGFYLVAVVVTFWYFHPIYTDALIPYTTWHDKMWTPHWI